jgi:dihydrolipoamide dehydrogenase
MAEPLEVHVPDLGTDEKVDVVEILVAAGESVEVDDGLITLESDKASMDVPSPRAGVVEKVRVKAGDKVGEGDLILTLKVEAPADTEADSEPAVQSGGGPAASAASAAAPDAEEPQSVAAQPEAPMPARPAEPPARTAAVEEPATAAPATAASDSAAPSPSPSPATGARHAEVLVLGAGPGGYTAAFRAADLGRKVVLVDRDATLGGVCLNVGCIPSKALLHVARVIDEAADLAEHGVAFGKPKLDLDKLRGWKETVVARLTGGLATMARKRGVEVVRGEGRLAGADRVVVATEAGEVTLGFDAAILAAGSRVIRIGGVPWDDPRVMDSTGALEIREVPKRLLVVGGGIIGLEMANVYAALGSKLTIVELLDGLIPGCDRDLVRPLQRRLAKRYGAEIHLETRVEEIRPQKNGLKAIFAGDDALAPKLFDRALVAVGRRPNGDRIGREAAGLELDERGFLPVDRQQRTASPRIFAIGDMVPGPMLAHKASHEGKVAAEVAAGLKSGFDARVIPSVAYTDPEIAWVGLTETAAKAAGTAYEVGRFPWGASGRALGMGREEGLTKILFDPDSRRVLGAGVVGSNAGDLIAELALAIEMDCEAADLGLTIHPHPTLSETVAFAAEVFEGTITDLYLPRRKRR